MTANFIHMLAMAQQMAVVWCSQLLRATSKNRKDNRIVHFRDWRLYTVGKLKYWKYEK